MRVRLFECLERFLPRDPEWAPALAESGVELAGISDLKGEYEMGRPESELTKRTNQLPASDQLRRRIFHFLPPTRSGHGPR